MSVKKRFTASQWSPLDCSLASAWNTGLTHCEFIDTLSELHRGNLGSHTLCVVWHSLWCTALRQIELSLLFHRECDVALDCSLYDLNWQMSFLSCYNSIHNLLFFSSHICWFFIFLRGHYDSENQGSTDGRQKLHLVSSMRKKCRSLTNEADGNKVGNVAF